MENIEITAKVIRRAVDDMETQQNSAPHSFQGAELAHSLGSVLSGAFPLLMSQNESETLGQKLRFEESPIGAQIIRAVRSYDMLVRQMSVREPQAGNLNDELINELRHDVDAGHSDEVLDALSRVVLQKRAKVGLTIAAV